LKHTGIFWAVGLSALIGLVHSAHAQVDLDALDDQAEKARKAGNYKQAITLYEKLLALAPTGKSSRREAPDFEWCARTFLALSYNLSGNPTKAIELYEENLKFARHHSEQLSNGAMNRERDSIQSLAAAYTSIGDLAKAESLLEQVVALDMEEDSGDGSLGPAKNAQELGITRILAGNAAGGEKMLYASLAAFDEALQFRLGAGMPSVAEYESQVEVIRWLQKSLVSHNQTDAALELAERGRTRAVSALLARRDGTSAPDPEFAMIPTIAQIKKIAAAQRSTVVEYSILYKYDPNLPLEFSDYKKIPVTDLLAWVIKPSGEIAFRRTELTPPLELAELVRSGRDSLGARGRGVGGKHRPTSKPGEKAALNASLRRLHQLLIEPIRDCLPSEPGAMVTFIPQDYLFFVPFAALQDAAGEFLIAQYALATAPSIQVLDLTRRHQNSLPVETRGALVVGNPTMPFINGKRLPPLPGAEQEAKTVAAQIRAPVMLGAQATKMEVLAQMTAVRTIHLATHGFLDDATEGFGSVALTPSDGDRGFLTSREISALRLNAELIVLSACDTAQGKITGDGIQGLSRSFIVAGASSVIVSLWSVPDAPTALLMSDFYRSLQQGVNKAEALRQAMLTTMRAHPQPLDWAAFTLVGNPDVSLTFKQALENGMGGAPTNRPSLAGTRYYVFPVPDKFDFYHEWPSQDVKGEFDISFNSPLSIAELISFYRNAFVKEGFVEKSDLTRQEKMEFQLVFMGSPTGKDIVVQGSRDSDSGKRECFVSVRFE